MKPCKIIKHEINRDKHLLEIIPDGGEVIYFLSSIKMQTGYISDKKKSYISGRDLIQVDKMGYKTFFEGIDRYMIDEKKYKAICKHLKIM